MKKPQHSQAICQGSRSSLPDDEPSRRDGEQIADTP